MCQQWLSAVGLTVDVVGFLLIAWEWHLMFQRHVANRIGEIDALYSRLRRKQEGMQEEEDEEFWSMGKHMYDGLMEDVRYRGKIVYTGVGLIIVGFLLQVLGSIPGGIAWIKVTSCSSFGFGP